MEWWILDFMKILLINIILSGDNAIVIAMASRNLPQKQRKLAIFWGAFGAIALRILLTIVAIQLLKIPFLSAIGAVLLVWIAFKLVIHEDDRTQIKSGNTLRKVIITIIMADFVMSLDNVIAIAAIAEGDLLLISLGLILSVPLIVWGSSYILEMIEKFPILVYVGAAILAFTGGEMFVTDQKVYQLFFESSIMLQWLLPIGLAMSVLLFGWMWNKIRIIIINF